MKRFCAGHREKCQRIARDRPVRRDVPDAGGFTLVELAVVILLISITLVFAVPRLPELPLIDSSAKTARWIILNVRNLKERAVREQRQFTLHVGIDRRHFWVTHEAMSAEERAQAEENGYRLPAGMRVADVEYPDRSRMVSGQAEIAFYRKGYSDHVMLHIADGQDRMSFQIEPFLSRVKVYERYVSFEG
jgi:prepilin-type N-terminal cleavage/methylation domain-containing protein